MCQFELATFISSISLLKSFVQHGQPVVDIVHFYCVEESGSIIKREDKLKNRGDK